MPNQNSFPLGGGRSFVAPFWADVDITSTGDVWYRPSTSQALLDRANMQISNAFPLQPQYTATHLIIVTWDRVGYFDSKMDKVIVFSFFISNILMWHFSCPIIIANILS